MNARMRLAWLAVAFLLAACGCGAQVSGDAVESARTARTAAQLDTAIARSSLPGAAVVVAGTCALAPPKAVPDVRVVEPPSATLPAVSRDPTHPRRPADRPRFGRL